MYSVTHVKVRSAAVISADAVNGHVDLNTKLRRRVGMSRYSVMRRYFLCFFLVESQKL